MKIIFVCTGNTCRSPMAEYIMRELCKKYNLDIEVESRGIACSSGKPISENSFLALQELGIDAKEHKSQPFILKDLFDVDLIVSMTDAHKKYIIEQFKESDKIKSFNEISNMGDVIDPYGCDINYYRMCRDLIIVGLHNLVEELLKSKK